MILFADLCCERLSQLSQLSKSSEYFLGKTFVVKDGETVPADFAAAAWTATQGKGGFHCQSHLTNVVK